MSLFHAESRIIGITSLYAQDHPLSVPDLVIQKILRHADVSPTQEYYIKVETPDARMALVIPEKAYEKESAGQTLMATDRRLNRDSDL